MGFNYAEARIFAAQCTREAGRRVLRARESPLSIKEKLHAGDIVTSADQISQEFLMGAIGKKYPCHGIFGEEGDAHIHGNGLTWVLDPVDGTLPMAQGMDFFGISMGLVEDGVPKIGAVCFPGLDLLVETQEGVGTFLNGHQVCLRKKVTTIDNPAIAFDFSARRENRVREGEALLLPLLATAKSVFSYGCCTYATLLSLQGKIDAFVHAGATVYDIGVVLLAIQEAGGGYVILNGGGKVIDPDRRYTSFILARNTEILRKVQHCIGRRQG